MSSIRRVLISEGIKLIFFLNYNKISRMLAAVVSLALANRAAQCAARPLVFRGLRTTIARMGMGDLTNDQQVAPPRRPSDINAHHTVNAHLHTHATGWAPELTGAQSGAHPRLARGGVGRTPVGPSHGTGTTARGAHEVEAHPVHNLHR